MSYIEFDTHFLLGHAEIDEQHAKLFNAVNQLYDAMVQGHAREDLGRILSFLHTYTVKHFETEERLMVATHFPAHLHHRKIHHDLAEKVADLEAKHKAGAVTLSLTVFQFLKDWLTVHIDVEDRKLVEFLLAQKT